MAKPEILQKTYFPSLLSIELSAGLLMMVIFQSSRAGQNFWGLISQTLFQTLNLAQYVTVYQVWEVLWQAFFGQSLKNSR